MTPLPLVAAAWLAAAPDAVDPARFEVDVLAAGLADPMQASVLADGSVLVAERAGAVKRFDPTSGRTVALGTLDVATFGEVGLVGLAADPGFARTGHLFAFFCPQGKPDVMRLARLTVAGDRLDAGSEKVLLEYPIDKAAAIHMGGGLAFGPAGDLYLGTGDNCPPIPEVPVDQRPGKETADALRSAANSNDLRGKVLRIRPRPDGGYDIPPGNLFPNGDGGRPEIFAMGCRNPFRLSVDPKTGAVYWGDVGPNIAPHLGIGPEGYDEVNRADAPGNFGWPLFTGPNEPFRDYDFATKEVGGAHDPAAPVNRSRNNTGAKALPPAKPAYLWYPTGPSARFPELGSGGRSAMAGPAWHDDPATTSAVRLPARYAGALFAFDWMRGWVKAVWPAADGSAGRIEPFPPDGTGFRRPIDLKAGPDGALYLLEMGDGWSGNTNGRLLRIGYRRGNRPPTAVLAVDPPAGRHPLTVTADAGRSADKDGDPLAFAWRVDDGPEARSAGPIKAFHFDRPGARRVRVTVTDSHGAASTAEAVVHVGNARPAVRFAEPADGGLFDWADPIAYRVEADDAEDGSTATGRIASDRVAVRAEFRPRQRADGPADPGLALMRASTCFGCHAIDKPAGGPPYAAVADKYKGDPAARDHLARKVLSGGAGVWGVHAMPPHPQHTVDQARQMVDWVLTKSATAADPTAPGADGVTVAPARPSAWVDRGRDSGHLVLTAAFADNGTDHAPPLAAEAAVVLHSRRQAAPLADRRHRADIVDVFDGGSPVVARLAAGGHLGFDGYDLTGIARLTVQAGGGPATIEVRTGRPDGPVAGTAAVSGGPGYRAHPVSLPANIGRADVFLVTSAPVDVAWVEFHDTPERKAERAAAKAAAKRTAAERAAWAKPRTPVRDWTVADLTPHLGELAGGRNLARGRFVFRAAGCVGCHRMGGLGGDAGPDLSDVGRRMSARPDPRLALLTELLEPSKVVDDRYRARTLTLVDGRQLTGVVLSRDAKSVRLAPVPPAAGGPADVPAADVESEVASPLSPMPAGQLTPFTRDEVLDLLAFLTAGGDPRHPAFSP